MTRAANRGPPEARRRSSAARRRSSIVSKSGTSESSTAASSARSRAARTSAGEPVPDTISVSSACAPWRSRARAIAANVPACDRPARRAPWRAGGHRAWPGGSRRAPAGLEERRADRQRPARRGSREGCIDDLEVARKLRPMRSRVTVPSSSLTRRRQTKQLAPVGSSTFDRPARPHRRGARARRARSIRAARRRRDQRSRRRASARARAPRPGTWSGENAAALERLLDRLGPGGGIAVLVAADPAPEAERRGASGSALSELATRRGRRRAGSARRTRARSGSRRRRADAGSAPRRSARAASPPRRARPRGRRARRRQRRVVELVREAPPSRRCAARTVRRVASVGCAVSTSSSETPPRRLGARPGRRRPRRGGRTRRPATRAGLAPRARTARRRRSRWCCSAMLASWK